METIIKSGKWLKEERLKKGLSQKEFAKQSGLNAFTVQNIEQGNRIGSVETWDKINKFFDKDIDNNSNHYYDDEFDDAQENSYSLISELKSDIEEFGENEKCILIYKIVENTILFTNYDFIVDEKPFNPEKELEIGEKYIETTLKYALEVFENQNNIF